MPAQKVRVQYRSTSGATFPVDYESEEAATIALSTLGDTARFTEAEVFHLDGQKETVRFTKPPVDEP